jgi:hypothetical protein
MRKQLGTSEVEAAHNPFTAGFDSDDRDHSIGRRDMLVGLWAGELLGLEEEGRAMYAMEVMAAGLLDSEPADIVDKISRDFAGRGIHLNRDEILAQVSKKHRLVAAMNGLCVPQRQARGASSETVRLRSASDSTRLGRSLGAKLAKG